MIREHWMYRAYDESGVLLYVGVTKNLLQRRAKHRSSSPWFASADRFVLTGPLDRESAYSLETATIKALLPVHNRTHREGRPFVLVPNEKPARRVLEPGEMGQRIKDLRERAGISRTELAQRVGISRSHLVKIEGGGRPSLAAAFTIAAKLGVVLDAITFDEMAAA